MIFSPRMWLVFFALLNAFFFVVRPANAMPIGFTFSGSGSGFIGSNQLNNAAFIIRQEADTADITSCGPGCLYVDATSTSIEIQNLGEVSFITRTHVFIVRDGSRDFLGLGRSGLAGTDLYGNFVVNGYDLQSSIGPIPGTTRLLQWGLYDVITEIGTLNFHDGGGGDGTFQAFVAIADPEQLPEPQSILLVSLALMGLFITKKRDRVRR